MFKQCVQIKDDIVLTRRDCRTIFTLKDNLNSCKSYDITNLPNTQKFI
jgi:hypothetical protein